MKVKWEVSGFGKKVIYVARTAGAAMHKFRKQYQKTLNVDGRGLQCQYIGKLEKEKNNAST